MLSVATWNVNGWTTYNSLLRAEIIAKFQFDIICICETHLRNNDKVTVDNYIWFGNNRKLLHVNAKKGSGGIGFLIKTSVLSMYNIVSVDRSVDDVIKLSLSHKHSTYSISIFGCYIPPQHSSRGRSSNDVFSFLSSQIYCDFVDTDCIVVLGDFNTRIGNMSDCIVEVDCNIAPRKVLDETKNSQGEEFIEFLQEMSICVLNGRFQNDNYTCISRKGKSVVDYLCVPHDHLHMCKGFAVHTMSDTIDQFDLAELISDLSRPPDHSIVSVLIHCSPGDFLCEQHNRSVTPMDLGRDNLSDQNYLKVNPNRHVKKYKYTNIPQEFMSNTEWQNKNNLIINTLELECNNQTEIDGIYKRLSDNIFSEMDKYLEHKNNIGVKHNKHNKFYKPYWNNELTVLWKDMVLKEKLFLKTECTCFNEKTLKRSEFITARSTFDKQLRYYQRQYQKQQIDEIENMCVNNHRIMWEQIKRLGPRKKTKIPEIVRIGDILSDEPLIVLEEWKDTFSNLFNRMSDNYDQNFYHNALNYVERYEENAINIGERSERSKLDENITYEETVSVITKLKLKKSVGIDYIPNEIIKQPGLHKILHRLFDTVFATGLLPNIWAKAIVNPIPKGSDKDPYIPINYRGISLLSCVSKTYTSLLNKRLISYCNEKNILVDEQNGFRKGRSCSDHLFSLTSIIRNRFSLKQSTYCAFIDMEKAFDFVDRKLLLFRLLLYGIDGQMYRSIKSLYNATISCVKLNDLFTDWFNCSSGVRQGDSLSPTLFALFINGLADGIKHLDKGVNVNNRNVSLLLYADDIVLISDKESKLQDMLNYMHDWCYQWKLKLNTDKSKVMHFRPKNIACTHFKFLFGEESVKIVSTYKYLGVYLDEFLIFDHCARVLSESAGRALGGVINKVKTVKDIGFKAYTKLYESAVISVNDYAAEIWGYKNFPVCNNVQNRAMRYYLGVHRFAPISGMQGDFGWLTPKFRRYKCLFNYWNRLVRMEEGRVTKHIFDYDYNICNISNNWCSDLKKLCCELNVLDSFENKYVINIKQLDKQLLELNQKEWTEAIQTKPKLRTYIIFKNEFTVENYIKYHMHKRKRSLLSQLRLGILPLAIETGRYCNVPLNDRLCKVCNDNVIENEFHFVMKCTLYQDLRTVLFNSALLLNPKFLSEMDENAKFVFLFMKCHKSLSQFTNDAFIRRKDLLYAMPPPP